MTMTTTRATGRGARDGFCRAVAAAATLMVAAAGPAAAQADEAGATAARAEADRARRIANTVVGETRMRLPFEIPPGHELVDDMILPVGGYAGSEKLDPWPGGVVPYTLDPLFTDAQVDEILAAMIEWEGVAAVDFVPWDSSMSSIVVVQASGSGKCNSGVGHGDGSRIVNLADWCFGSYSVQHEFGHLLGYYHEQGRHDRDDYVIIHEDVIDPDGLSNFGINGEPDPYGPYDFDSVMHYGATAFSIDGSITIETIDPEMQWVIGQRDQLSHWDTTVMSFLYPQDGWVFFGEPLVPALGAGTFDDPLPTGGLAFWAALDVGDGLTLIQLEPVELSPSSALTAPLTLEAPVGGLILR